MTNQLLTIYLEYKIMILFCVLYYSIIFSCNTLIEYMLKSKTLLDYTKTLLDETPNDYKKNDKIIYKYFKDKYDQPRVLIKKIR